MTKPRNDRNQAVTRFCLAMEEHRRTEAGRVRTAKELVAQFFPYDEQKATDQLFVHMPMDVRGPVLAKWGIRGAKAALKDDDAKVKTVVHDALVAGDVDENVFEEGITPELLIDWIALPEWWSFWRHGRLTGPAIQKALATAREQGLIDDAWFLANLQGRGGKLKGTDVLCDTLSKDQIVAWIRKLHETGDGSPAGLVAAIGWTTVLTKTSQDALLFALDQFARKAGLVVDRAEAEAEAEAEAKGAPASIAAAAEPATSASPAAEAAPAEAAPEPPPAPAGAPTTTDAEATGDEEVPDEHPTASPPGDLAATAEVEAFEQAQSRATADGEHDSGFPISEIPVIDDGEDEEDEGFPKTPTPEGALEGEAWQEPTATSQRPSKGAGALVDTELQRCPSQKLQLPNPPPLPRKPGEPPRRV